LKEKSMKRLVAIGAALAAAASFAFAQGPGYGRGGYGPGMMGGGPGAGGMLAALNLSDEQREKVLAIQEDNRRKNWAVMGEMRSEQFKLRSMARGEKLDDGEE
jgi:Spy/CpxP family protein refolding chaperone